MAYNSHGATGKRDANEPDIIKALEADGCIVKRMADCVCGDLLVFWTVLWRDPWTAMDQGLIEVKMPKARLKPGQAEWAKLSAERGIRYAIVHSQEEALEAVARWRRGSR